MQAIRGLPLFCKDTPEYLSKIVDILVQLLAAGNWNFYKRFLSGDFCWCSRDLMLTSLYGFRGNCGAGCGA